MSAENKETAETMEAQIVDSLKGYFSDKKKCEEGNDDKKTSSIFGHG